MICDDDVLGLNWKCCFVLSLKPLATRATSPTRSCRTMLMLSVRQFSPGYDDWRMYLQRYCSDIYDSIYDESVSWSPDVHLCRFHQIVPAGWSTAVYQTDKNQHKLNLTRWVCMGDKLVSFGKTASFPLLLPPGQFYLW